MGTTSFMRRMLYGALALSSIAAAGCRQNGGGGADLSGAPLPPPTGIAVTREVDAAFPNRTIWRPTDLNAAGKLPILLWGEGGCMAPASTYENPLREVASHDYFVIASGLPDTAGATTAEQMRGGIDLAIAENTKPGGKYAGKLDTTKIAAAGHSCGGLEALTIADDPRLTTVFVWNSGIFGNPPKKDIAELHTPVLWITGGASDVAYNQAKTDYQQSTVPSVWANYGNVGHRGGEQYPRGGLFTQVELRWMDWHLKGKTENRTQFVGTGCGICTAPWVTVSKNWA